MGKCQLKLEFFSPAEVERPGWHYFVSGASRSVDGWYSRGNERPWQTPEAAERAARKSLARLGFEVESVRRVF